MILLLGCAAEAPVVPEPALDEASPIADVYDEASCGDGPSLPDTEGAFVAQGTSLSWERPACRSTWHATAGARDSVLRITLESWEGSSDARLSVRDLGDEVLVEAATRAVGDAIDVVLPQTGEVFIHLEALDPDEPANAYAVAVDCIEGCDAAFTRYPIVLLHGMGGAESFGEVAYFYRVVEVLGQEGYALDAPSVSPFASSEQRGAEWEVHLDALLEQHRGRRFNLVAHSQGGLDARYLISVLERGDDVASLVTIGTPHRGTRVADVLLGTIEDGPVDATWVDLGAAAFADFYGLDGDHSLVAAMSALSTESVAAFNEHAEDHPDVYYASWAGLSCGVLDLECQDSCSGEVVDPLLAPLHLILWLDGSDNDGMVPVSSAVWGDHRGLLCADHADEVGMFEDEASDAFDHLAFYRSELQRLAEMGL